MIIKYKLFEDSKSFEAFQMENDISIHSIAPIIGSMDMDVIAGNKNTQIETKVSVFVTYSIGVGTT